MATKTTVQLVDDLDDSAADETIEFGVDGVTYEIDLTTAHGVELREALAPWVEVARRTGGRMKARSGRGGSPATATSSGGSELTREERDHLRVWADRNGFTVAARGRISGSVIDSWRNAGSPES